MIIIEGNKGKYWIGILASIFLGMTFIVAGIARFYVPVKEFEPFTLFDFMPAMLVGFINTWLMPIEFVLGLFLVAGIAVKFASCLSLLLVAGFITTNILTLVLGLEDCLSCFGELGELTAIQSLVFDGVLVALVIVILLFYRGSYFSKRPWYW